jgi:hypothetical protein
MQAVKDYNASINAWIEAVDKDKQYWKQLQLNEINFSLSYTAVN